ncbi:hypothetical protein Q9L58_010318 [Maublancomyces gigas]|uniref:HNH nuclease domain-containing protein n=1 Tax=Discina gigas TaxID=1032678 RepID=A0ABR3G4U6_9PEZI
MSVPDPDDAPRMSVGPQSPTRILSPVASTHLIRFAIESPRESPEEAHHASILFFQIIHDCKNADLTIHSYRPYSNSRPPSRTFSNASDREINQDVRIDRLYTALYVNSPTEHGKINLVRMILHGLFCPEAAEKDGTLTKILPLACHWPSMTPDERQPKFESLVNSARDILFRFFTPLMAQGGTTPPTSATFTPASGLADPGQGTPNHDRNLSSLVRRRDGHRCVVSGVYDAEFIFAEERAGLPSPDDEGGTATDAAHIIPHALNNVARDNADCTIGDSQVFVSGILDMFDPGVLGMLAGPEIDNPCNALLLAHDLHREFGKLHVYLEEVPDEPHSYCFKRTRGARRLRRDFNPKSEVLTFANCEHGGLPLAPLPSRRLLKLHAACCRMLEMAGAAEYVENLLDDFEELGTLATDGSSEIGVLWGLYGL